MIKREIMQEPRCAFYWVERILNDHKDYFLSKEEIYARFPKDDNGVSLVSISSLDNALRNLAQMRHIEVEYMNGKRYFAIAERRESRYD